MPGPENVKVEIPNALPRETAQRLVAQLGELWDVVSGHDQDMERGRLD